MKVALSSLLVDDQAKALKFYTEVLGFVKHVDIPIGEFRWLTVVSPEGSPDFQLVLEPNAHPAAKVYQKALFDDGIPATAFQSSDIHKEYEKLAQRGVVFRGKPTQQGPVTLVVFEDTCGNLIQLFQT
ncbi:VOC family protein [Pyxidicoccus parkwayensis]|uniref:VOC family protein n=1 Tax=Pyxidicoccus parkwayensis TaxID=2813578 RepID=A0ABX7P3Y9_9BACT|nr:VOC family protein [Pyxidicoccus parkwaysis]QSQ25161.1 VOC family protein [Pyxidicoccus parkwaysis]